MQKEVEDLTKILIGVTFSQFMAFVFHQKKKVQNVGLHASSEKLCGGIKETLSLSKETTMETKVA